MAVDTIEKAIYSLLAAGGDVAELVATRIYPLMLPQPATLPAVTYQRIAGDWDITMDGANNYAEEMFQVNCWATSYKGARQLADTVRKVLDNYDDTTGYVQIHCIHLEDEGDMIDMSNELAVLKRCGKRQDYRIWYKILT